MIPKREKMCQPLKHAHPVKNSDLHTTSALDAGVKNGQIWHKALNK